MHKHLSLSECESYATREIGALEALLFEIHIRDCPECFQQADDIFFEHNRFRFDIEEIGSYKLDHPAEKHLKRNDKFHAYITGELSDFFKEDVELHARICRKCRRMLAAAQKEFVNHEGVLLKGREISSKRYASFSGSGRWAVATLAVALLMSLLIWAIARQPDVSNREAIVDPGKNSTPGQENHNEPDPATTGGGLPSDLTADRTGTNNEKQKPKIETLRDQSPVLEGAFLARANALKKPSNLPGDDELPDGQVRGVDSEHLVAKKWKILGPIRTLVQSMTPQFRWSPIKRADFYEVSIYDASFNLIDSSGPVKTTWWQVQKPLTRGEEYRWMVTAIKDGIEILAAPPRGAAFEVIEEAKLIALQDNLRGARSPGERGVIYAEAGLLDVAQRELQAHLESHPYDRQAKELVRRIRSWLRGAPVY